MAKKKLKYSNKIPDFVPAPAPTVWHRIKWFVTDLRYGIQDTFGRGLGYILAYVVVKHLGVL